MSTIVELKASARERVGKGAARTTRSEGLIPAVIYGDKKPPKPIALDRKETTKHIQTGNFLATLFNLEVDGETTRVIPRDVQFDPVKDFPLHIDFLRLGRGAKIAVEISVHFENEEDSPGLRRGGVLNVVRYAVELMCPADSIPEMLTADLTGLDIGDSIHISDITLPEGVTPTITDRDFTVATIAAPVVEPVEEEEGEDEEAEGEEGEEGEGEEGEGESEEGGDEE